MAAIELTNDEVHMQVLISFKGNPLGSAIVFDDLNRGRQAFNDLKDAWTTWSMDPNGGKLYETTNELGDSMVFNLENICHISLNFITPSRVERMTRHNIRDKNIEAKMDRLFKDEVAAEPNKLGFGGNNG